MVACILSNSIEIFAWKTHMNQPDLAKLLFCKQQITLTPVFLIQQELT